MKRNIVSLFLLMTLFSSCKKYLDLVPKGKIVLEDAEDFHKLVSFPNRGYATNQFMYLVDDYWMREAYVIGQTKTTDIFNFTYDSSVSRVVRFTTSSLYNRVYVYINQWNMIIDGVDNSKGPDSLKTLAKAEARIFRAFDHFLLVNTFAKHYNAATAETDGGICIMDKYDLEAKPVKASVAEVYRFVEKDIDESIPHLQVTPADPYHPSLAFAYALKAKVHLFKKEFDKAEAAALKSLEYNNVIFDLVDYAAKGGTAAIKMPAGTNPEILSIMFMTGYTEMNIAYSQNFSPELRNLFGATDARFRLFYNTTNASFLDIGAGTTYWSARHTDYFYPSVGMRTPEVYLMLAECYARRGALDKAMETLNLLRSKRITSPADAVLPTPATEVETVKLIINERRREMVHGFNRFWDLRRFNTEPAYAKTLERRFPIVSTAVPQQTYTLPPGSQLYILPFAQDVLKQNPGLTINTNEALPW